MGSGKVWDEDARCYRPDPVLVRRSAGENSGACRSSFRASAGMNERLTDPSEAQRRLTEETGITEAVAEQFVNYVKEPERFVDASRPKSSERR